MSYHKPHNLNTYIMGKLDPLDDSLFLWKKNLEKLPFCKTQSLASLHRTDTDLIRSGPKVKNSKTLYINFHEKESNAFSKSISNKYQRHVLFKVL